MNDSTSWGWLQKTGGPQILYAWLDSAEMDVPSAENWWKGGDDLFYLVELSAGHDEVKTPRCKDTKIYEPHFWGWFQKGHYT